jgi:hypothetical protein
MAEPHDSKRVDFTVSLSGTSLTDAQQKEVEAAIRQAAGAAIAKLDLRKDFAFVNTSRFPIPWPGGWWVFRDFKASELNIPTELPHAGMR